MMGHNSGDYEFTYDYYLRCLKMADLLDFF